MWYGFFTAVGSFRIPVWQPDSIETGATAASPTFNYERDTLREHSAEDVYVIILRVSASHQWRVYAEGKKTFDRSESS
jgi:hypothetical protein